jgi:predicted protein tyrosine phosphatase
MSGGKEKQLKEIKIAYNESISPVAIKSPATIFISDYQTANDPSTWKKYNIQAIISATESSDEYHVGFKGRKLHIKIEDVPHENIAFHFDKVNQFIDESLQKGENVLVHCMAGISRSVSLVISYLMYKYKFSYIDALLIIQKTRPIAFPNVGFKNQLIKKYTNANLGEPIDGFGMYN